MIKWVRSKIYAKKDAEINAVRHCLEIYRGKADSLLTELEGCRWTLEGAHTALRGKSEELKALHDVLKRIEGGAGRRETPVDVELGLIQKGSGSIRMRVGVEMPSVTWGENDAHAAVVTLDLQTRAGYSVRAPTRDLTEYGDAVAYDAMVGLARSVGDAITNEILVNSGWRVEAWTP